ncbi:hypothetical protein OAJ85_00470 [Pseudomonadota bacterium]|nr:hypothetical protein [Pseudomonadota bacterium]
MLNFIDPQEVKIETVKTENTTLNLVQTRLRTFLKKYKTHTKELAEGKDKSEISSVTPNLLVKRTNGLNLALKIANETAQLVPIEEGTRDEIAIQIENVIQELPDYRPQLHQFYLWVAENTGKKKQDRTPRPQISWSTQLQEAS